MTETTEEKKRFQGQRGATPKEICPQCGEYLQIAYIRKSIPGEGKRTFKTVGLACPSNTCDYIKKDVISQV